ncbi:MAG: TetR/AcrR family transcriptional regulator [bacterium]
MKSALKRPGTDGRRVQADVAVDLRGVDPRGSDGRNARWDVHRAQRREALLAAAVDAVRAHGAGVGMDQIAAAAGTSKAVFYRYFADKADLYRSVGRMLAGALVARVTAAVGAEDDHRARLAAGVNAYLRLLDEDPELYRFVVHNPVLEGSGERFADYTSVVSDLITALFDARLRERGADPEPADPWGVAVVGAVRAAGDWWLENPGRPRAELAEDLTDLLWSGMVAVGSGHLATERTEVHA